MRTSVCVRTPRTYGGYAPATLQVLSYSILLSACCRPAGHPFVFLSVLLCSLPRFFSYFWLVENQSAGKQFTALAFEDRRDLYPSILFFASSCHITREICPPRTRLPYRRRSCQRCVVHHPEGKEPNRIRIALCLDSVRRRYRSRLLLWRL